MFVLFIVITILLFLYSQKVEGQCRSGYLDLYTPYTSRVVWQPLRLSPPLTCSTDEKKRPLVSSESGIRLDVVKISSKQNMIYISKLIS